MTSRLRVSAVLRRTGEPGLARFTRYSSLRFTVLPSAVYTTAAPLFVTVNVSIASAGGQSAAELDRAAGDGRVRLVQLVALGRRPGPRRTRPAQRTGPIAAAPPVPVPPVPVPPLPVPPVPPPVPVPPPPAPPLPAPPLPLPPSLPELVLVPAPDEEPPPHPAARSEREIMLPRIRPRARPASPAPDRV